MLCCQKHCITQLLSLPNSGRGSLRAFMHENMWFQWLNVPHNYSESWFLHAGSDGLVDREAGIIVGSILGVLFLVAIFWCITFSICLQVSTCPLHNIYYKRTIQNLAEAPPMQGHPGMRAAMQRVWLHHTLFSLKPSRQHSDNKWYCLCLLYPDPKKSCCLYLCVTLVTLNSMSSFF